MDHWDREPRARRRVLRRLLVARMVAASVMLGSATAARVQGPDALASDVLFVLLAVSFGSVALHAAAFRAAERHRWLVDAQLAADALVVSAAVLWTGGVESQLVPLFVLPVVGAAVVHDRRGALLVATLSTLLLGTATAWQYAGRDPAAGGAAAAAPLPPAGDALLTVVLNGAGLACVAWLTGYLAERLRHADARLQQASTVIADLQAFSQCVIDSLTGGLATTDLDGTVLTFNRAAEQITGWTAAQARGRSAGDVLQLPRDLLTALPTMAESGRGRRVEVDYLARGGRRVDLGVTAAPLMGASGRVGLLFTFQDITERTRREREAQTEKRLAAIGEMAAGIAHEIRNPLASMAGSIQVLRQDLHLSAEQSRLMDIVLRESQRLNDIIRDFLAYARPQRRPARPVDLGRVVHEAAVLLANSAERRVGHQVVVDTVSAPCVVEGDEGQLRQIVWNLATNAFKAMPDGGRLQLGVDAEAGRIELTIRDEGIGIPAGELDHVFEPFRSTLPGGTGLGLSIVHRLVRDAGGSIDVESVPGRGTTVRVLLPRASAGIAEAAQALSA